MWEDFGKALTNVAFAGVGLAALAAEQLLRANGKHYNYFLDGKPYVIGVNAESRSGKFYYCRQIESMTDYKVTETTTVENTEAARRLAWAGKQGQRALGGGREQAAGFFEGDA